jgi:high-affinity Fe2+/Pb2+ permease
VNVRTNRKRAEHNGSTFDSFLEQEEIREEVEAIAIKRVVAWQLEQAMQEQQKTKRAQAAPAYRLPSRKEKCNTNLSTKIADWYHRSTALFAFLFYAFHLGAFHAIHRESLEAGRIT